MSNGNTEGLNFSLDRLACPSCLGLRAGAGLTTSDGVTLISNQEFHGKDVVILYGVGNRQTAIWHSKTLQEIAEKMGFKTSRDKETGFQVEGRGVYHVQFVPGYPIPKFPEKELRFLSGITKELCDKHFFLRFP